MPVNPRTFGNPSPVAGAAPTPADETAIRQTIVRYEQALASLDPAAVRAVYPSVNVRGLATQFGAYESFKSEMQVGRIQMGPNGRTAMAIGFVTTAPVLKATGQGVTQRRPMTILLRKVGDSWLIEDTRFPARAGEAAGRANQPGGAARRGRQ